MFPCFRFWPKPTTTQNKKLKDKSNNKCKLDKPSSSSAKPATASSSSSSSSAASETLQVSNIRGHSFTFRELATATNNFKKDSLIGKGGFGDVFKGRLESIGQNVAVKKLDDSGPQGDKEFLVEVLMLSLMDHENLVTLFGYCAEGNQRLLVYKYMPLGSVEDHLHDLESDQEALDWSTRMKIAAGAAKGLEYLHNVADPPVIYRDLKTSNILLDHGYKPKLSDFGLAKFVPSDNNKSHISTRVMGTHGYCAPEYAYSGKLTLKSDIYSFGVVMLELITGRKALLESSDSVGPSGCLVNWAHSLYKRKETMQLVDPKLYKESHVMKATLRRALEVAFHCLREDQYARPSISEVVEALDYIVKRTSSKKKSIDPGRGGYSMKKKKKTRMLNVNEEEEEEEEEEETEEALERKRAVDEAKSWAIKSRHNNKSPSSVLQSGEIEEVF